MALYRYHHQNRLYFHVDADAFFASVAQSLTPSLRGKPVVTGLQRGMVIALSYEAKRLGITRGMPLYDVIKKFPTVHISKTDYEACTRFSNKMHHIFLEYTPWVEMYSIDEGYLEFRNLTDPDAKVIAKQLQQKILSHLSITVSIGIGKSKTIAKLLSPIEKPFGISHLSKKELLSLYKQKPIDDIAGIGARLQKHLKSHGVFTIRDFIWTPRTKIKSLLGKNGEELWFELQEIPTRPIDLNHLKNKSISKFHTLEVHTSSQSTLKEEGLKRLEDAHFKLLAIKKYTQGLSVIIRTKKFIQFKSHVTFKNPTKSLEDLIPAFEEVLNKIYNKYHIYRGIGVTLMGLTPEKPFQLELPNTSTQKKSSQKLSEAIHHIKKTFGKEMLHSAGISSAPHKTRSQKKQLPYEFIALDI